MELTHLNEQGYARMVDVTDKAPARRTARAVCEVIMQPETAERIRAGGVKKGDVLAVAEVAGIMAAKRTSEAIPLCHPVALTGATIRFAVLRDRVRIESEAVCTGNTGVEMEALHAASVAALTIYDMCKAMERGIRIEGLRLIYKDGGSSGVYTAEAEA